MVQQVTTRVESGFDTMAVGADLGFYDAMGGSSVTAAELAARTSVSVRYARDWLEEQAQAGYVERDPATGRYATWCSWPRAA